MGAGTQDSDMAAPVGRTREIQLFERFLSSESRALVLWGAPGQGKSTLVRHLRASSTARRTGTIDLEQIVGFGYARDTTKNDLARMFLDQLATLFAAKPGKPLKHYWNVSEEIDRSLLDTQHMIRVSQTAVHGAIIGSPVIIHAHGPTHEETLSGSQRRVLTRALIESVSRPALSEFVLFIDTSERLHFLDDVAINNPLGSGDFGIRNWFTHQLIPNLVRELPKLRVVIAGWQDVSLPSTVPAMHAEVLPWPQDGTCDYAQARGVSDHSLHQAIHRVCAGNPTWTSFLLDSLTAAAEHTELISPPTTEGSTRWLLDAFFDRLGPIMREVLPTASIPRVVHKEAITALTDTGEWPADWFERLCGYSFFAVSDSSGSVVRRIHPVIRQALLGYLFETEPDRHRRLHQRAREYYAGRGSHLDETYHAFASGDTDHVTDWRDRIKDAREHKRFDNALALVETVMAPEQRQVLVERAPGPLIAAYLESSRVALAQGRFAVATSLAMAAKALAERFADARAAAESVHRLADVPLAQRDLPRAEELLTECLVLCRAVDDTTTETHVAQHLATIAAYRQEWSAAATHLENVIRSRRAAAEPHPHLHSNLISLAWIRMQRGDLASAFSLLDEAQRGCEANGDRIGLASCLEQAGYLHAHQGDLVLAAEQIRRAVELHTAAGDSRRVADTQHALADMFLGRREYAKAKGPLLEALAAYTSNSMSTDRAHILRHLADAAVTEGDLDSAAGLLEQARALFTDADHLFGLGRTLLSLGSLMRRRGDAKAARDVFTQSLKLGSRIDDRFVTGESLEALGRLDLAAGEIAQASATLAQALPHAHDGIAEANVMMALATAHRMNHQPELAIPLLHSALERYRKFGERRGIATVTVEVALIARARGDHQVAEQKLRTARETYLSLADKENLLVIADPLAHIAIERGNVEDARVILSETLEADDGTGSPAARGNLYALLATVEPESAVEHLNRALECYERGDNTYNVAYTLHRLGAAHRHAGDLDEARRLLTRAVDLDEPRLQPNILIELGSVELDARRPAEARRWLERVSELCHDEREGDALLLLTKTCPKQTAYELLGSAQARFESAGDIAGQARVCLNRGELRLSGGDLNAAEDDFAKAVNLFDKVGQAAGAARSLGMLGRIAQDRGAYAIAAQLYSDAAEQYRRAADPTGEAWVKTLRHSLG